MTSIEDDLAEICYSLTKWNNPGDLLSCLIARYSKFSPILKCKAIKSKIDQLFFLKWPVILLWLLCAFPFQISCCRTQYDNLTSMITVLRKEWTQIWKIMIHVSHVLGDFFRVFNQIVLHNELSNSYTNRFTIRFSQRNLFTWLACCFARYTRYIRYNITNTISVRTAHTWDL